MKKITLTLMLATVIAFGLAACSWKPSVTAVPITAPWAAMNLPVKENAVVWASSDKQLKVVHKENRKTILGKYNDALKADGWKLETFDDKSADRYQFEMTKGADKINVEIYDFENTGVIIDMK